MGKMKFRKSFQLRVIASTRNNCVEFFDDNLGARLRYIQLDWRRQNDEPSLDGKLQMITLCDTKYSTQSRTHVAHEIHQRNAEADKMPMLTYRRRENYNLLAFLESRKNVHLFSFNFFIDMVVVVAVSAPVPRTNWNGWANMCRLSMWK